MLCPQPGTPTLNGHAHHVRLVLSEAISGKGSLIGRKKPEREAQAGTVVGQVDAHPMKGRDRFDQAEAEPASGLAAAAFQSIKTPKHASAICSRNSRPAVDHGNGYCGWRLNGRESYGCSRRGMLHRGLDFRRAH